MALIDRTGFVHDDWVRIDDDDPLDGAPRILVSLPRYLDTLRAQAPGAAVGLYLGNDTRVSGLLACLDDVALIAIEFPSSSDGRGFSLARQLRRLGYRGELRAVGPLIADQFAFALRCGFDTVHIPDDLASRQPEAQWRAALASIDLGYQCHYDSDTRSILERRVASRRPPRALAA